MPDGKVAADSARDIIVSLKPALTRAAVTGAPKLPEALKSCQLRTLDIVETGTTYPKHSDFLDCSHC